MDFAEAAGYLASVLVFLAFYMKTMIPLRIIAIASNCAFIVYGYLDALHPVLILHLILLPLNGYRLYQIVRLTRQVEEAIRGDLNMEWLRPFTSMVRVNAGDVVFRKGDAADHLFVVVSGRLRLVETGIEINPPNVVGEFALLAPERQRTQTAECVEAATLLKIGYAQVEQLFFQNPGFGFYFLKLVTRRLFNSIETLETELASSRQGR
jgi:hypothetical protein